nr:hypothetical protein [Tanacetum cinerariifolium]
EGTKALIEWIDEVRVAAEDLHLLRDGPVDDSKEESPADDSDVVGQMRIAHHRRILGGATTSVSRNSDDGATIADGADKIGAVGIFIVEVVGDTCLSGISVLRTWEVVNSLMDQPLMMNEYQARVPRQ